MFLEGEKGKREKRGDHEPSGEMIELGTTPAEKCGEEKKKKKKRGGVDEAYFCPAHLDRGP